MDALARANPSRLRVIYLHSHRPGRQWKPPQPTHEHIILDGDPAELTVALGWIQSADLVVIGYYRDSSAAQLICARSVTGRPWCFWGERMGVTRGAGLGALYRRWKLRALHRDRAAIWGIGEFALQKYRREFGNNRIYCNVPYFSNLARFDVPLSTSAQSTLNPQLSTSLAPRTGNRSPERRVLFSGSLIQRKGVDLLASAFRHLASEFPNLALTILGDGPERSRMEYELADCRARVQFVGFKDWDELPSFYREADVLCVPSRHDGWGLVVPEGLAAGLPVIGTDRTGAALELLRDGINGWLVEAGNGAQLFEALRKAARLTNNELAAMSRAAVKSVETHQLTDGVRRFEQAVSATLAG